MLIFMSALIHNRNINILQQSKLVRYASELICEITTITSCTCSAGSKLNTNGSSMAGFSPPSSWREGDSCLELSRGSDGLLQATVVVSPLS